MGDKGKKDKGKREEQKKDHLSLKEKRRKKTEGNFGRGNALKDKQAIYFQPDTWSSSFHGVKYRNLRTTITRICTPFRKRDPAQSLFSDESPLRAELFSAVQMEQHGKILARAHQLVPGPPHDRLLERLTA